MRLPIAAIRAKALPGRVFVGQKGGWGRALEHGIVEETETIRSEPMRREVRHRLDVSALLAQTRGGCAADLIRNLRDAFKQRGRHLVQQ